MPDTLRTPAVVSHRCGALLLALAGLLFLNVSAADDDVSKENQIKAAFLYNFSKYIEWPATSFATATTPVVIGTYCADPFGLLLRQIVKGRKVSGRDITVRTLTSPAEAGSVHIVFVCRDQASLWNAVTDTAEGASVLTVADSGPPAPRAMIVFVLQEDRVRFSIDMDEATRARLKVSDQLQKLAIAVKRTP